MHILKEIYLLTVALAESKAKDEVEALSDPSKKEIFNKFKQKVKMAGFTNDAGDYVKGIEDYLPLAQYERIQHRKKVVEDILENWLTLSQNGKFHALFATTSIHEAIEYFRLIKTQKPELKITALFDSNIDNSGSVKFKEDGLVEIMEDYNKLYEQDFKLVTHSNFKKDIAARLAHKEPYQQIEHAPEKQLDLLIVVDQMLTGFDSKWINTLYMDKVLRYENIIQAFSRTNRLFGPDKPFGTIRYYRKPHTMEQNINEAVKLYSGDKPLGLFVEHLDSNLKKMNSIFEEMKDLFQSAGVQDFTKIPDNLAERGKFAKLFKGLNSHLEAAKIQGFKWSQSTYEFSNETGNAKSIIEMKLEESAYLVLALRYKELFAGVDKGDDISPDVPFEIDGYLTQIDTGVIDANYMNLRFDKYLKMLKQENIDDDQMRQTLDDLHKSFAYLTQEEQKYANIFLHDIQSGNTTLESGKSFREYVTDYKFKAKNDQLRKISHVLGLDESKLKNMMNVGVTETNINQYGRFDDLKDTVDKNKAKEYFESLEGATIPPFKISIKTHELLQRFITSGGFEIHELT